MLSPTAVRNTVELHPATELFRQCFGTVGGVTGMASGLQEYCTSSHQSGDLQSPVYYL